MLAIYRQPMLYALFSQTYKFWIKRATTIISPAMKMEVKISLLCFANQLGRKISKLSFLESEYLRATKVRGQNILKTNNTTPSPIINPIPIQVKVLMLLVIPEYKM
jgi:hypothetical protein